MDGVEVSLEKSGNIVNDDGNKSHEIMMKNGTWQTLKVREFSGSNYDEVNACHRDEADETKMNTK